MSKAIISIEEFDRKTAELHEQYRKTQEKLWDKMMKRQAYLVSLLSQEDKEAMIKRETEKRQEEMRHRAIVGTMGLVDPQGRKIGNA